MLIKILPILHIIATYYYIECLEPKGTKENLEQAFLSRVYDVINNYDYEFDNMPIYSTPNTILHPNIHTAAELIAIQYAPLEATDNNNHKHTHAPKRTEPPTTEHKIIKPQELEEKHNLQPEWSTVQMIDRQPKARSFFSGRDVSVIQSKSNVETHGRHDLYRTYHNHVDQTKLRNAEYSSFQNPRHETPEEELLPDGRTVLYLPGSGKIMPLQERKYVRKVVPFVLTKPFLQGAFARAKGTLQKSSDRKKAIMPTEKQPSVMMQQLSALSPGLHLNLARVYGIAHTNDQRHIDVPHRWEKPPFLHKKSVDKKKVILHPIS